MYLNRLGDRVPAGVKSNGEKLFWRNRVTIVRGTQKEVQAEVEDAGVGYAVRLVRSGKTVLASCPCPAAKDLGVCAHIWASVLMAERRSHLAGGLGDGLPEVLASVQTQAAGAEDMGTWLHAFHHLKDPAPRHPYHFERDQWPLDRQVQYILNPGRVSMSTRGIAVELRVREKKRDGSYGKTKTVPLYRHHIEQLPDAADREIFSLLAGAFRTGEYIADSLSSDYTLAGASGRDVARLIAATERCFMLDDEYFDYPVRWAGDEPFVFRASVSKEEKFWAIEGKLRAADGREVSLPDLLHAAGGLFVAKRAPGAPAPLIGVADIGNSESWLEALRKTPKLTTPINRGPELLSQVMSRGDHPPFDWHEELQFQELRPAMMPWLLIREARTGYNRANNLVGTLTYLYDKAGFKYGHSSKGAYLADQRTYVRTDPAAESQAAAELQALKLRSTDAWVENQLLPGWEIPAKRVPEVVSKLAGKGWRVEMEGKVFRNSTGFHAELSSDIDWFDLQGGLRFEGQIVEMPALLKALRRGENIIQLSDGSYGVVPDEIRQKLAPLLHLAHDEDGALRFRKNQAGLLDVLLAQRPEITFDEAFAEARRQVREFQTVQPAAQPEGFQGTLREYQREGVGWMQFLQRLNMGGILADDMGVGKTPQMLALLETRRVFRPDVSPSLAVVPRSLVYNWKQEAAKFTPQLRVLDHTSADRVNDWDHLNNYDLILSTYGTLRRDASDFRNFEFDYIILDEAQNIKNSASESAKAARLLNGRHRVVLTGTPIENHLGELWSLIEFLNPGMMGSGVLQSAGGSLRNPDPETRVMLAKALRPYILRRTKEQVAKELPPKVEQTVYCELEGRQKKLYNELRDHYRQALLGKIDLVGMSRTKLQVLEALLRLRQAACHPGLVDKTLKGEDSAKLETLLDQLESISAEGHKALVFSQFTSLLAIVGDRLTAAGVNYEYLDGRTRDRQARVERFQAAENCPVFLISLKAGGTGLNLTAADYVFILDPWWNPAVEAQAVDRAHRIGQDKQVFAYRLIARDTVEEKVLLLQERKKDLADAIIQADEGMFKSLRREDLEILLG